MASLSSYFTPFNIGLMGGEATGILPFGTFGAYNFFDKQGQGGGSRGPQAMNQEAYSRSGFGVSPGLSRYLPGGQQPQENRMPMFYPQQQQQTYSPYQGGYRSPISGAIAPGMAPEFSTQRMAANAQRPAAFGGSALGGIFGQQMPQEDPVLSGIKSTLGGRYGLPYYSAPRPMAAGGGLQSPLSSALFGGGNRNSLPYSTAGRTGTDLSRGMTRIGGY